MFKLTFRYPVFAHSMEVQTFTTDRGAPTLAMSIAGIVSNLVRHSYIYNNMYVYTYKSLKVLFFVVLIFIYKKLTHRFILTGIHIYL